MQALVLRTQNHTASQQAGSGMRSGGAERKLSQHPGFHHSPLHFRFHWIFSLDFLSIQGREKVIPKTQNCKKNQMRYTIRDCIILALTISFNLNEVNLTESLYVDLTHIYVCVLCQKLLLLALTSNRTDYIETLLDLNISLSEENINKLYWVSQLVGDMFYSTF